eukprot:maker-scaffold389_size186684-snap-gene-0.23 protein:Tk00869 transcript:maker-scaffold389_size186684-snap-gene-0.23-mRNA-1 annotation:"TPA: hypothetical protein BOS_6983"
MDYKDPKTLIRAVEALTTSGLGQLDEKELKTVKKICKSMPDAIPYLWDLLVVKLKRKHSEVRLSTFQLINEIFQRSHVFRTKVVNDLDQVIELTLAISSDLPPPKSASIQLKRLTLATLKAWVQKFGEAHKKLPLAYNYLKRVKQVDFHDLEARNVLERQSAADRITKMDNIWKERVKKVKVQMEETHVDVQDCRIQMENCFELLVPTLDQFDQDMREDKDEAELQEMDDIRGHGLVSQHRGIHINIGGVEQKVTRSEENGPVLDTLRDQLIILSHKLIPMTKAWCVTLSKAGENCDSDTLKQAIDVKQILERLESKALGLGIDLKKESNIENMSDSDSDDDDFIEVPSQEFNSLEILKGSIDLAEPSGGSLPGLKPSASCPIGSESNEEALDPTTFAATLKKMDSNAKGSWDKTPVEPTPGPSKRPDVPVLPYDVDLYNWEEEVQPQKVIIDNERLRFWGGSGRDDDEMIVPGTGIRQRNIAFTGTFEEVKWSCRAPLPSGRLCPRMDRVKCPLHGKVIGRSKVGNPTNIHDKIRLEKTEEDKRVANPDWQDPKLLADIKAATGRDLTITKKGTKLKGRNVKKHSGLTNVDALENTSRKRLEKKVFNRSSLRRVAENIHKASTSKSKDKFGDQFNYVFQNG